MGFLGNFCRYFLASVLLATSIGKLLDVPGFVNVLRTYQSFPEASLKGIAVAFVLVELKLSEWLFSGKSLSRAALTSALLHLIFMSWAGLTLNRGISVPNCGCFGVFLARPLTGYTVIEDAVMVGISILLWKVAAVRR